jgi:hypothetical protein
MMLTKTATPPKNTLSDDDVATMHVSTSSANALSHGSTSKAKPALISDSETTRAMPLLGRSPMRSEPDSHLVPSSPTLAAMAASPSRPPSTSRRVKLIAVTTAILCGVGLGLVAVKQVGQKATIDASPVVGARSDEADPPAPSPDASDAPAPALLANPGGPEPPGGSNAAPVASEEGIALSLDEIPDSAPVEGGRRRVKAGKATKADTAAGVRPGAAATPQPTGAAASTGAPKAAEVPKPPPTGGSKVPAVQDPGF